MDYRAWIIPVAVGYVQVHGSIDPNEQLQSFKEEVVGYSNLTCKHTFLSATYPPPGYTTYHCAAWPDPTPIMPHPLRAEQWCVCVCVCMCVCVCVCVRGVVQMKD